MRLAGTIDVGQVMVTALHRPDFVALLAEGFGRVGPYSDVDQQRFGIEEYNKPVKKTRKKKQITE